MSEDGSTILLATDSVHVSAAAADLLERRSPERIVALAVGDGRDEREALNAARVRLAATQATVETSCQDGDGTDPAVIGDTIADVASEHAVDEIVIGHRFDDRDHGLGPVTKRLLVELDRPLLVVPVPDASSGEG